MTKLRHIIWCIIVPKIADPEAYISLYHTCKYFQKLVKRYNYLLYGGEYKLSIFDCGFSKKGMKVWYGNVLYSAAGQWMGPGDSHIVEFTQEILSFFLEDRNEYHSKGLLSLPYKGAIRRCRIPKIEGK